MVWIWKSGVNFSCVSACCFDVNEASLGAHLFLDDIIVLCSSIRSFKQLESFGFLQQSH